MLAPEKVKLRMRASQPAKLMLAQDTLPLGDFVTEVSIERKREKFRFSVASDQTTKDFEVKNKLSATYWVGNIMSPMLLGYLVDHLSTKPNTYRRHWYFDINQATNTIQTYRYNPHLKNRFFWSVSLPLSAQSKIMSEIDYSQQGFLGLAASVGYYLQPKGFIEVEAGANYTGAVFRNSIDLIEREFTHYANLTYNYHKGLLNLGAGLNLRYRNVDYTAPNVFDKQIQRSAEGLSLGLAAKAYVRLGKFVYLGATYQPGIFHFNKVYYDHLLAANIKFKFIN
jgi:hypothetical protein